MEEEKIEEIDEKEVREIIEKEVERRIKQQTKEDTRGKKKDASNLNNLDDLIEEKIREELVGQHNNNLKEIKDKLSRRGFLKALGVGAGGLALSSSVTGASLLSGTTVDGYTVWHTGNDGSGSGLSADDVDGYHVEVGSSKPSSPPTNTLFFDTLQRGTHYYNGSSWKQISSLSSLIVIDDFESGSLDSAYTGSTSNATVQSSTVYEGSYALELGGSGNTEELVSTSGLNAYPQQGDTFSVWYSHNGGYAQIMYGVQDMDNWYLLESNPNNDRIRLYLKDSTGYNELQTTTWTASNNTWYEFEVDWQTDGTHAVTVYDTSGTSVATLSANDSTHTSGGIGYRTGGSTLSWFDYWIIK